MMTMFGNVIHHWLIAQCQLDVMKITRWGRKTWVCSRETWKLASFAMVAKAFHTRLYEAILSPPYTYFPHHVLNKESGSLYDTKVVYKCNVTPPKTKNPDFALLISGTAKLNLWNAIPSVNTRQACRGTKSELKIKHRANEYTCILHVVEECKIRLWRY